MVCRTDCRSRVRYACRDSASVVLYIVLALASESSKRYVLTLAADRDVRQRFRKGKSAVAVIGWAGFNGCRDVLFGLPPC